MGPHFSQATHYEHCWCHKQSLIYKKCLKDLKVISRSSAGFRAHLPTLRKDLRNDGDSGYGWLF